MSLRAGLMHANVSNAHITGTIGRHHRHVDKYIDRDLQAIA